MYIDEIWYRRILPVHIKGSFTESSNYAWKFVRIGKEEIIVIMQSRKSLLFDSSYIRINKDGDPNFDVTRARYDEVKICELLGLNVLHILEEKYGEDKVGLYRDDSLACLENVRSSQAERIRKRVHLNWV